MLASRCAIVTGSTSGMGFAIAKMLVEEGASCVLTGLASSHVVEEKVSEARSLIADPSTQTVCHIEADLRDPSQIRGLIAEAATAMGGHLDVLVNNAGCQRVGDVQSYPEAEWDRLIAVNLSATFHASKAALPYMQSRDWGRIINTGSMHSLVASPYKAAYTAAKHGVAGFTKSLALELSKTRITCNAVCPGYTWTELIEGQLEDTARVRNMTTDQVISDVLLAPQPSGRFVRVDEVAAFVRFLCGDSAASINGACLSMDGGWTAQ